MNLKKLFEVQKMLRDRINYNEPDRFNKLILALLVELGECANEWRGFKFWSKDQKPRTNIKVICSSCNGTGDLNAEASLEMLLEGKEGYPYEECDYCLGTGYLSDKNPLLEEYVDGLHFVLEIDLQLEVTEIKIEIIKMDTITDQFNGLYNVGSTLAAGFTNTYDALVSAYLGLGEMLGFTWIEIEKAYVQKNRINHQRQEDGY